MPTLQNMNPCIIIHYDEIAIKGKNRKFFEDQLIKNINEKIKIHKQNESVQRMYGRFKISFDSPFVWNDEKKEVWNEILSTTFGIANYGFGYETKNDEENLKITTKTIGENETFTTFRITTNRINKDYPKTSMEVNHFLGGTILKNFENKKVKLKKPDLEIFVEILGHKAFFLANKNKGGSGLPVGCSGKAVVLISGGIDSPVATFFAQKRGLETIFIHFHSYPQTSQKSVDKVRELVKKLTKFNPNATLYMCPFLDVQKEIFKKSPDKFRILLYRRFMYRIAEKLAKKIKAKVLITGESLGQVASQTIENMTATQDAVEELLVLRPLIGFDKKDIIEYAKKIDTYQISIRPHEDCCTVYMPKNPETKARINEIKKLEQEFNVEKMVDEMMEQLEIETYGKIK